MSETILDDLLPDEPIPPESWIEPDKDYVFIGKWKNAHGEIMDFERSRVNFVIYYGTCPFCGKESISDVCRGTYADPTFNLFCPFCGKPVLNMDA